jgi:hypothetical protein
MEERLVFRAKFSRRFDNEIGPNQTARLIVDGLGKAVAERSNADERCYAERDRDREEQ